MATTVTHNVYDEGDIDFDVPEHKFILGELLVAYATGIKPQPEDDDKIAPLKRLVAGFLTRLDRDGGSLYVPARARRW